MLGKQQVNHSKELCRWQAAHQQCLSTDEEKVPLAGMSPARGKEQMAVWKGKGEGERWGDSSYSWTRHNSMTISHSMNSRRYENNRVKIEKVNGHINPNPIQRRTYFKDRRHQTIHMVFEAIKHLHILKLLNKITCGQLGEFLEIITWKWKNGIAIF